MALPLIIAAGASIASILGVVAKYLQAFFQAVQTALFALYAWYQAHKIIFSLFLFGVMLSAWAGIAYLFSHYSAKMASYTLASFPELSFLDSGCSYLNSWVDLSLVSECVGVAVGSFCAVMTVRTVAFSRRLVFLFVTSVVRTFRG